MYGGPSRQWRIDTLLMHVETIAGVFGHIMLWLQGVILPVPIAVTYQVAVRQLTTLWYACRSTGIKQNETAVGFGLLYVFKVLNVLKVLNVFSKDLGSSLADIGMACAVEAVSSDSVLLVV